MKTHFKRKIITQQKNEPDETDYFCGCVTGQSIIYYLKLTN